MKKILSVISTKGKTHKQIWKAIGKLVEKDDVVIVRKYHPDETLEEQLADLGMEDPNLRKLAVSGPDCDVLPNATGAFGHIWTNPIPVNGVRGEFKYLKRLRCPCGTGILFHRVAAVQEAGIPGSIDVFETVCLNEKHWDILFLHFLHPRRSTHVPKGYTLTDFKPPANLKKVPYAWGTYHYDAQFPFGIGQFVEKHFPIPHLYKSAQYVLKNKKFQKPAAHKSRLEQVLLQIRSKTSPAQKTN